MKPLANISIYLQAILDAVYGEEVRGSIHDALYAMNAECVSAMEYAAGARDSAQTAAAAASSSASTAAQKVTEATQKATAAANSATNAANSAATAAQKVTEAAQQVTRAAEKVDEAAEKVNEAAAHAANSEASALRAAEQERLAHISATQAGVSEENAGAAELNAAESAAAAVEAAEQARFYSGKPPKPYNGTWWIWDMDAYETLYDSNGNPIGDSSGSNVAAVAPGYVDTHISCDLEGPQGVGISDISLTSGDHSPGTSDVYTVTMTDGSTYTIAVWNGRNGSGAGDVLGIEFDLVIPAAGWSNGAVTVADNRLIAQAKYKYYLIADGASREEFLNCKVQPGDIDTAGFISFTCETAPTHDLTVNITRFELSANG